MSAQARDFRVGLFVLVGITLMGGCVALLGGGSLLRTPQYAETYFDESVAGLEVGAPIKYRGVSIGRVAQIGFVGQYYDVAPVDPRAEYVLVRLQLGSDEGDETGEGPAELPERIERGLRTRLTSQGITGLVYVETDYLDPRRFPPMQISWQPEVTYVPSAPSALLAFTSAAERILEKVEAADVEAVLGGASGFLSTATEKLEQVDVPALQTEVVGLAREARATNLRIQRTLDAAKYDLEVALENLRVASDNLRDLTETASSYPSLMILGEPPKPSKVPSQ
jgi:paraquat-inducible protein B